MALVASPEETREAASRIRNFLEQRASATAGAARA
jgi:hypothetical protein